MGVGQKEDLQHYLQAGRRAVLWKIEGLSEYDVRRPMVRTGTNLLGLVKHLTGVELGYLGDTFGRPFDEPPWWYPDSAEPNVDMWATPDESRDDVVEMYQRACSHSDVTIDALSLDSAGEVRGWPPERSSVTLHQILVHVISETHRHAGHADLVRELVDGAAGLRPEQDNLPGGDDAWWHAYRGRLEEAAIEAAERAGHSPRP